MEAVRGDGYRGDIAIDDISISSQACTLTPPEAMPSVSVTMAPVNTTVTPANIPAGFVCNFETNVCGWTQDTKDNFDWSRHQGTTGTEGTGSSTDHNGSTKSMPI